MLIWALLIALVFLAGLLLLAGVLRQSRVAVTTPDPGADRVAPRQFFQRLLRELRHRVRGLDPRYDIPWVALLGPPGSGKSMLGAGAGTPGGLLPDGSGADDALRPFYLNGGVLIEVAGTLAFPAAGTLDTWRSTLRRIRQERPQRPLDGIVLALPVDLFAEESSSAWRDTLASMVRSRLQEIQAELGFLLPVYILVTKTDHLPGFREFAAALPEQQRQNLLGWSSPYRPDLPFDPIWIDEAMAEMYRGLVHTQMDLYGSSALPAPANSFFAFPSELRTLRPGLRGFLSVALRPSAYDPQPIFRGIYFTGESPLAGELYFARDLFEQKIFAERGLGTPLGSALTARNRDSRAAQAIALALALVLAIGTGFAASRLSGVAQGHARFLETLDRAQEDRAAIQESNQKARLDRGYRLIQSMSQLRSESMHSWWLPATQIAPLEPQIAAWFQKAFGLILLDFRAALADRGRHFGEARPGDSTGPEEGLYSVPEYRDLRDTAAEYRKFAASLATYNSLAAEDTGTLAQFNSLAAFLTRGSGYAPIDLPAEPYSSALRQTRAQRLDCGGFGLETRLRTKMDRFAALWFREENPVARSLEDFIANWTELDRGRGGIVKTKRALDQLAQSIERYPFLGAEFDVREYPALAGAPFLREERFERVCPVDVAEGVDAMRREHDALRDLLLARSFPGLNGAVLESYLGQLSMAGRTALIRDALNEIANLGYLVLDDRTAVTDLSRAAWDAARLDEALRGIESFEQFRLPALDRNTETAIRNGVREQLVDRIRWAAAEGEDNGQSIIAVLDRFRSAAPLLRRSRSGSEVLNAVDAAARRNFADWQTESARQYRDLNGSPATDRGSSIATRSVDRWFSLQGPDRINRWNSFVDEERDTLLARLRDHAPLIRYVSDRSPHLAARWRSLLGEVERYDARSPQNAIVVLETALRTDLPAITPDKGCLDTSAQPNVKEPVLMVRNRLLAEASERCRQLRCSSLADRYASIRGAYRQFLASRFPYSEPNQTAGDLSPTNLAQFYAVYQAQGGAALAAELRGARPEAAAFIQHFDLVRPLYAPTLDQGLPFAVVDLQPEFRIHRESELGGHHIAEWILSAGPQTAHLGEPPKPLRWSAGMPVSFRFRLAKDSPLEPASNRTPGVRVSGKQIEFTYSGAWSLLSAIIGQRAADGELPGLRDTEPYSLGFSIPVLGDPRLKELRVFLRLRLLGAGKKEEIRVPSFPYAAPEWKPCEAGGGS